MSGGMWVKELPLAITVCDEQGIIREMNDKSCQVFEKKGGHHLIGSNVLDCHPEKAAEKIKGMLESRSMNCYITKKDGVKRLIYQTPWYQEGEFRGIVEFIMDLPDEPEQFQR